MPGEIKPRTALFEPPDPPSLHRHSAGYRGMPMAGQHEQGPAGQHYILFPRPTQTPPQRIVTREDGRRAGDDSAK
ncbi:hypothetical protein CKAH01_06672 [Colletotrichum kahawae]|uniref:Uncharacterized protein n=1 Tax=Colletotrichum kahawae TaxID=34407 RepID=A0AAD9Y900_COLKA|nr:hypothetical protein CKAH01_06672 [Colletotrichum kahawae]